MSNPALSCPCDWALTLARIKRTQTAPENPAWNSALAIHTSSKWLLRGCYMMLHVTPNRLSPKISTELAFNMERTVQLSLQNGFNLVGCSEAVA